MICGFRFIINYTTKKLPAAKSKHMRALNNYTKRKDGGHLHQPRSIMQCVEIDRLNWMCKINGIESTGRLLFWKGVSGFHTQAQRYALSRGPAWFTLAERALQLLKPSASRFFLLCFAARRFASAINVLVITETQRSTWGGNNSESQRRNYPLPPLLPPPPHITDRNSESESFLHSYPSGMLIILYTVRGESFCYSPPVGSLRHSWLFQMATRHLNVYTDTLTSDAFNIHTDTMWRTIVLSQPIKRFSILNRWW